MSSNRRRPSHGTIVAYLALFVALGGSAYAAARVDSSDIKNDSVRSVDLENGAAVTGRDVKAGSLGGKAINESKLRTVPSAAALRDVKVSDFSFSQQPGTAPADVYERDGLRLEMSCPLYQIVPHLVAYPSAPGAVIWALVGNAEQSDGFSNGAFAAVAREPTDSIDIASYQRGGDFAGMLQVRLGQRITTIDFSTLASAPAGEASECRIQGQATSSRL